MTEPLVFRHATAAAAFDVAAATWLVPELAMTIPARGGSRPKVDYGAETGRAMDAAIKEMPDSLGLQVELAGLEPATSWVRSRRSPN